MTKSLLICGFLILSFFTSTAQVYKFIYYLDKDLVSTDKSQSLITGKGFKDDTLFQLDYFNKTSGQYFMTVHFVDSSLKVMEGAYKSIHRNGKRQEEGQYKKGRMSGLWLKWDSSGNKLDSIVYNNERITGSARYTYFQNNIVSSFQLIDSIADIAKFVFYDSTGIIIQEANFKGNAGSLTSYENGAATTTSVSDRDEKEAEYPSGSKGFVDFLGKNLRGDIATKNGARPGTYTVIVRFIIEKDGRVSNIIPETNLGYGMEEEVIRIIKSTSRWIPARQFGIPVKAYRRQPITFMISEE